MRFKWFLFTFIVGVLLFLSFKTTQASTLFSDDFSAFDSEKWTATNDAAWHIENGQYGLNNFGEVTNSVPSDQYWDYTWENISYSIDVRSVSGFDKNVLVKFVDTSNFIEIHHSVHQLFLVKYSSAGGTQILGSMSLGNDHQVVYKYRTEILGNSIKVYLNDTLIFDAVEPPPLFENWKIGMRMGNAEVWYDNVVVSSLDGEELISLDVPDLKQYSPPWEDDLYDQATEWSFDPTMRRWGCAVTSAAMVLGFHGFDIDPGELNSWLKSKPDGYLGNGLVNWLAISRYTKQNPISGVHALEFRRYPYSPERQLEELEEQRPSILKEPNHFAVAKSQTEDSFGINDPGYSDRPTLASYSNTAQNLYSYIPSSTDLSYILLTIDPSFNLTVKDPDGLDIEGYYWIEEPLVDDVDGSETSGDPVGIFMYPKPTYGNYLVGVQGNGSYSLGTYLYDEDGNVLMQDYNGFGGDLNDEYLISVGDESFISFPLDNILNDLDQLYLDGKFKNFGSYNSLRKQLLKVEEFLDNNQVFNAKVLLDAILLRLTHANKLGEELEITQLRGQIQNYYNTI